MDKNIHKLDLGWSDSFNASFVELSAGVEGALAARIVREDRGAYRAMVGEAILPAEITGVFRHSHDVTGERPAVGDWVVATLVGMRKSY